MFVRAPRWVESERIRRLLALVALLVFPAGGDAQGREPIFTTRFGGPRLHVRARVATEVQPKSISISPDGQLLAVCHFGRADRNNVFLYDSTTLERVGAVHFEGNAVESAWSADGRTLYVSNFRRNVLEVIDVPSRTVVAEVPVGSHPKTVTLDVDGTTVYVANYFGNSISVVDARTLREVRRLPTGERPRGLGMLADGTLLAASFRGESVHVFPRSSGSASAVWEVCPYPRDILPAPGGDRFYLTCTRGYIGFHRPQGAGRPFGIAWTGANPRSIAITADGRYVGVANFGSSDVTLIDTVARTHRRTRIPNVGQIVGLAMHPDTHGSIRLYATSWQTAELILLSARSPRTEN